MNISPYACPNIVNISHSSMITEDDIQINESIFESHRALLKNLEITNSPLLVFISGTFCMGKSTICGMLEDHLKGIRINGDQIRNILDEQRIPTEKFDPYIKYCIERLKKESANGLIILDKAVGSGTYNRLCHLSPLFTIRLQAPRSVVEERIRNREHMIHNTKYFLTNLDKSWEDYERASRNIAFDYVLDNSGNDFEIPLELIDMIQRKL